jgi:MFS family permease
MSEKVIENTPLTGNERGVTQVRPVEQQSQQLRIIYLIHFLSTISTSIFSFVMFVLYYFNGKDAKNPGDSSKIQILFIISQVLLSIIWGYCSDKIGRKKVLNICLIGSAFAIFLFGFCNSTGPVMFASFLAGAFSCVCNVVRTILGESTNESNRPFYFTFLFIIAAIAFQIGLKISTQLIQSELPILFSCLISSGVNIICFVLSHLYLSETLGKNANLEEKDNDILSTNHFSILAGFDLYTILGLSISKNSIMIVTGFPLIAVIFNGFKTIFNYWPRNEVSKGGLNLEHFNYGKMYLVILAIVILSIHTLYSSIHKRLGSLKLYKAFFLPAAVVFILSSMITLVARTGNASVVLILLLFAVSSLEIFNYFQHISLHLLLIDSSESTGNLGTLFGISGALVNVFNFIIPSLFQLIYKYSTESGLPLPLNYNLVWIILTTAALIGYWLSSKIKNL